MSNASVLTVGSDPNGARCFAASQLLVTLAEEGWMPNISKMGDCEYDGEKEIAMRGIANPAVIDLFALDERTDQVLLVMHETRPWDDSDERLHQLQEKFNAYVSFFLDGEMVAAHPELAGKKARIELRCDYMPDERALAFLDLIHNQIALQEIRLEVIVARNEHCGEGCGCPDPADSGVTDARYGENPVT